MQGNIFINYRRADTTAGYAISMYQLFSEYFDNVFLDVDTIVVGEDFNKKIMKVLKTTDVLIVLIGKNWLTVSYSNGKRRLDDQKDFVRKEIVYAIKKNIIIAPILFDDVEMPRAEDLPFMIKTLSTKNIFRIRQEKYFTDVEVLIQTILKQLTLKFPDRSINKKVLKSKLSPQQKIEKEIIAYEAKKEFKLSKMKVWSEDKSFLASCLFKKGIAYIQIAGYLATGTLNDLDKAIRYAINNGTYKIIIDCKNLAYISSSGLGVLFAHIEGIRERGGDIKIVQPNEKVYNIFDLLGITILYEILNTIEEAELKFEGSRKK